MGERIEAHDNWVRGHRRDGERLAQLTATIDQRLQRLAVASLADRPRHLRSLLGLPPETRADRHEWATTAAAVEAWREVSGRSPDHASQHLLAEPGRDQPEHEWWQRATRHLDHYQHRHRTQAIHTAIDGGTGDLDRIMRGDDGLDRTWQQNLERGLSR